MMARYGRMGGIPRATNTFDDPPEAGEENGDEAENGEEEDRDECDESDDEDDRSDSEGEGDDGTNWPLLTLLERLEPGGGKLRTGSVRSPTSARVDAPSSVRKYLSLPSCNAFSASAGDSSAWPALSVLMRCSASCRGSASPPLSLFFAFAFVFVAFALSFTFPSLSFSSLLVAVVVVAAAVALALSERGDDGSRLRPISTVHWERGDFGESGARGRKDVRSCVATVPSPPLPLSRRLATLLTTGDDGGLVGNCGLGLESVASLSPPLICGSGVVGRSAGALQSMA